MKTRNAVLGVAVAGLLAGGIWWMTRPQPAPPAEKPVATAPTAPAVSPPKLAAPVAQPKVAAPVVPPTVVSTTAKPAITSTTAANVDPQLNAAVTELITDLEAQDATAFVRDFLAPSMMDMARTAAETRLETNPNMTPEIKAQVEQALKQQEPKIIDQIAQTMSQNPSNMQGMQKLGAALLQAQSTPPQMNATGDSATYALDSGGDKDIPPSLTFTLKDGKWVIDMVSLMQATQNQ